MSPRRIAHKFYLLSLYYPLSTLIVTYSPCQGKNPPSRTNLYGLSDPVKGEDSRKNERREKKRRPKFSLRLKTRNSYLVRVEFERKPMYDVLHRNT